MSTSRYIVVTVDRYNSGLRAGKMVSNTEMFIGGVICDEDCVQDVIRAKTKWLARSIADEPYLKLTGQDVNKGLVWWEDFSGAEFVTEVQIRPYEKRQVERYIRRREKCIMW